MNNNIQYKKYDIQYTMYIINLHFSNRINSKSDGRQMEKAEN